MEWGVWLRGAYWGRETHGGAGTYWVMYGGAVTYGAMYGGSGTCVVKYTEGVYGIREQEHVGLCMQEQAYVGLCILYKRTLHFLLYNNDMYRSSNQMRFVHIADDTTVFTSDGDIKNVHATVNRELVSSGSRATDFLSTLVKLHIMYDNLQPEKRNRH